jgi:hypothetical protein
MISLHAVAPGKHRREIDNSDTTAKRLKTTLASGKLAGGSPSMRA